MVYDKDAVVAASTTPIEGGGGTSSSIVVTHHERKVEDLEGGLQVFFHKEEKVEMDGGDGGEDEVTPIEDSQEEAPEADPPGEELEEALPVTVEENLMMI